VRAPIAQTAAQGRADYCRSHRGRWPSSSRSIRLPSACCCGPRPTHRVLPASNDERSTHSAGASRVGTQRAQPPMARDHNH
jgi:hypothetical protein